MNNWGQMVCFVSQSPICNRYPGLRKKYEEVIILWSLGCTSHNVCLIKLTFCRFANLKTETVCIHIAVTSDASISTKRDPEARRRADLSFLFFIQNLGLKVYSQDPRYDLNIVQDSRKPKISWWNTGCGLFQKGSAIRQQFSVNFGMRYVIGKENGFRERDYRSSGWGIVIKGIGNTGPGKCL